MANINQLYETITQQIVEQLADGVLPWHRPWSVSPDAVTRPVRENGVPYQGINILILWAATLQLGYTSPYWMTYRQASSLGAQVRRGERATHVVFAKTFTRSETDPITGDQVDVHLPVRRAYAVFNVDQIDDLPVRYAPEPPPPHQRRRAQRTLRRLVRRPRHRDPPRRLQRLLCPGPGSHPDAAVRELRIAGPVPRNTCA